MNLQYKLVLYFLVIESYAFLPPHAVECSDRDRVYERSSQPDAVTDSLTALLRRKGAIISEYRTSAGSRRYNVILQDGVVSPEFIWTGGDDGLVQVSRLAELESLSIESAIQSASALRCLQKMRSLRNLTFTGTLRIDDDSLREVARCKGLRQLHLDLVKVSDKGIAHFRRLRSLTVLDAFCDVTDEGMPALCGLRRLRGLGLAGPRISDVGVESLRRLHRLEVALPCQYKNNRSERPINRQPETPPQVGYPRHSHRPTQSGRAT